jgi:hypothetical protein
MAKTITENIRKSLTTGLIVYDQNGEKVGYIDQAFGEQGWMQIRVSEFGRKTLWVPYRLVSTADMREIFVSASVVSWKLTESGFQDQVPHGPGPCVHGRPSPDASNRRSLWRTESR